MPDWVKRETCIAAIILGVLAAGLGWIDVLPFSGLMFLVGGAMAVAGVLMLCWTWFSDWRGRRYYESWRKSRDEGQL
jgi:hypothetical protein